MEMAACCKKSILHSLIVLCDIYVYAGFCITGLREQGYDSIIIATSASSIHR